MIWIQENKGLAAFLGISLVGCAALGFMAYGDYGGYTENYAKFDKARKSVKALESQPLYPDQESIDLKKTAIDTLDATVSKLRADLVKFQEPLDEKMTGNQFQAELTNRLDGLRKLAERKSVTLPETFRLDFDDWVDTPAPQLAVKKLDFQLDAVSNLVTTAIQSGISEVVSTKRDRLKEESGKPAEEPPANSRNTNNNNEGKPEVLLERFPVEFVFRTPHEGLVNFLNAISNASLTPNHFFIVRLIEVQNDTMDGPLKEDSFTPIPILPEAGAPPAPTLPGPLDPAAPVAPGAVSPDPIPVDPGAPVDLGLDAPPTEFGVGQPTAYYDTRTLLGSEQVKVFVKVEVIRFEEEKKKEGEGEGEGDGASTGTPNP